MKQSRSHSTVLGATETLGGRGQEINSLEESGGTKRVSEHATPNVTMTPSVYLDSMQTMCQRIS